MTTHRYTLTHDQLPQFVRSFNGLAMPALDVGAIVRFCDPFGNDQAQIYRSDLNVYQVQDFRDGGWPLPDLGPVVRELQTIKDGLA